jgi:hypothetical protein
MRIVTGLVCGLLLLAGCAHSKPRPGGAPPPVKKNSPPAVIKPDLKPVGRVEMVNREARFVVLSFPPGRLPQPGEHWCVNHRGMKVGEVKISGPRRDVDTVADLIAGEANVGDDVAPE